MMPSKNDEHAIRFLLNGEAVTETQAGSTTTVLRYLREQRRLSGTKEGCAEGDCGACTVVIGELAGESKLKLYSLNACIQFLPALDGKALFTVEYLRNAAGDLHPVQQAMVDYHGSQCGFCTPGFVMSLWGHYLHCQLDGAENSREAIANKLSGNLCRCTGYKPILEAGEHMLDYASAPFDETGIAAALHKLQRTTSLNYVPETAGADAFHAPKTLAELLALRKEKPTATMLAGGTDVGLWVTKQLRSLGDIIYTGNVAELKTIEQQADRLRIGAAVSLNDAYAALTNAYPQLREMWERFASVPVRNAGTLGGNVANGSPIGDSMPWLISLGAEVVLASVNGSRTIPLEDLYTGYMQQSRSQDEIVAAVIVPMPQPEQHFRTYKVSKRYDSDISAVCAAFNISLDDAGVITACRIAFGGMAATAKRASQCEAVLLGQSWNETTMQAGMQALGKDYAPLSDMRASAAYRQMTARNLLKRFFLETRLTAALEPQQTSVFVAASGSQA